jgi:hypothetical protein
MVNDSITPSPVDGPSSCQASPNGLLLWLIVNDSFNKYKFTVHYQNGTSTTPTERTFGDFLFRQLPFAYGNDGLERLCMLETKEIQQVFDFSFLKKNRKYHSKMETRTS